MAINPLQPPVNYMAMMPQDNIGQGFAELGQAIAQRKERQQAEELRKQYAADLQSTLSNPTPEGFAALSAKYPQQREAFKQSWDMMKEGQKEQEFLAGVQAFGAINAGSPQVAAALLDERIAAKENSSQDASKLKLMRSALDQNPQAVAGQLGLVLSSIDPDKWSKMTTELRAAQKAPAELTEAQAKAQKAAVDARFAESNAVIDLQKKGWDITKIQEDIKIAKENNRIAALNAAISREGNNIKRQEMGLKLQEMKDKRDEAVRGKAAEVSSLRAGIDNGLSVIDRLIVNPELDNVLGAVEGSDYYPSTAMGVLNPFADSDKRADALADIETVRSQSFINNLITAKNQGATFGALDKNEGAKLEGYIANLKTKQSEKQFRGNMAEIQRLLLKSRKMISEKYGVPDVIPDTPAVQPSAEEIDALVAKHTKPKGR